MALEPAERSPPPPHGIVRGYFVPVVDTTAEDPVTLSELVDAVLKRWVWVLLATLACLAAGVTAAYSFTRVYHARVVLAPVSESPGAGLGGLLSQFGGIASLAGLSLSGSNVEKEAIATLNSRTFALEFIEENGLLTVFYASRWDADKRAWKPRLWGDPPDLADAFERFDTRIRSVNQDRRSGLVTLTVAWRDPVQAAEWANQLVARANDRLRTRAVAESRRNIEFLQKEMERTEIAAIRDSIARVIEGEVRRSMLANGRAEYAFRVIDPAMPLDEDEFASPNRALLIAVAGAGGLALGMLLAVAAHLRARGRRARA